MVRVCPPFRFPPQGHREERGLRPLPFTFLLHYWREWGPARDVVVVDWAAMRGDLEEGAVEEPLFSGRVVRSRPLGVLHERSHAWP